MPSETQSPRENLIQENEALFSATFHSQPSCIATAPGRVNLIGDHTDYNDGFVLPVAVNRWIAVAAGPRPDNELVIFSANLRSLLRHSLDDHRPITNARWGNYVIGVALYMKKHRAGIAGTNISIKGNLPQAAGLGSSAALGIAVAFALRALYHLPISDLEIIRLCQSVENEFVGVRSGVMDQFVSAIGKVGRAVFLDCRTLEYRSVAIPDTLRILICNTGAQRELATSGYNRRQEECTRGVGKIAKTFPGISSLRDVSLEQLNDCLPSLDPVIFRRCRHVVTENERVVHAVRSLESKYLSEFGKLMYQSHLSLRNDFEVSTDELDAVVDICGECEGVYGARMTGAGFGGSAICMVEPGYTTGVIRMLNEEYLAYCGRVPEIFECTIEEGASVTSL